MADKMHALIDILFDETARVDEKDDAAMYLGRYDDDIVLEALISYATNPNSESFVMDACGESIAKIWERRNFFDPEVFKKLPPQAQSEIKGYFEAVKPELLNGI